MTFEGFDAAPLIEGAGFSPLLAPGAAILVAGADGTLEAALQAAGPGPRAMIDPHDLWAGHGGRGDIFERGGAGRHGWAMPGDADHAAAHGAKDVLLRAALYGDDVDGDGKEDEPIVVKGTNNVSEDSGGDIGGNYGAGFYPGTSGSESGNVAPPPHKVADHPPDCGTDDGAAEQVAKHVMGTPPGAGPPNPITSGGGDWKQVEYGAVIVRNPNGSYGALNDAIYSNGSPGFVTLPSFVGTNAVGFWHDHTTRDDPNQQAIDRYPSSQAGGDWDELQRLHDQVAPGDASFDPSMWITGPDGATREFKLSERSYYESLESEQMAAGVGLNGKERTQSCG